jgi:chromosomal replication initiation ATPase DnaA
MVLCMARENTGLTLRELGEAAGGMDYAAVGEAVRRLRKRLKEDRSIRKAYKHAVQILQIET